VLGQASVCYPERRGVAARDQGDVEGAERDRLASIPTRIAASSASTRAREGVEVVAEFERACEGQGFVERCRSRRVLRWDCTPSARICF